ncbi:MAG: C39 family peptidase [Ruminococcus sp.]|nr:C39 family peptidase [Ruminococcus sp.]
MEKNKPKKKRVTKKQLQRRRIGGLIVLLILIFLICKGCASCASCMCSKCDTVKESIKPVATGETTVTSATTVVTTTPLPPETLVTTLPESYEIDVPEVLQGTELPTGSEITALTMVLNYLGFEVSKTELAMNYLTCADRGTATFSQAFIGSPFDSTGLGCFAPVISNTAQKYLKSQNSGRNVKILNADSFDDVLLRIASGYPVMVWVNQDLEPCQEEYCFTLYGDGLVSDAASEFKPAVTSDPVVSGVPAVVTVKTTVSTTAVTTAPAATEPLSKQDIYWIPNATCVVLSGFDLNNGTVTVIDPAKGKVTYDMGMFKTSYNALYKQAIVIY